VPPLRAFDSRNHQLTAVLLTSEALRRTEMVSQSVIAVHSRQQLVGYFEPHGKTSHEQRLTNQRAIYRAGKITPLEQHQLKRRLRIGF